MVAPRQRAAITAAPGEGGAVDAKSVAVLPFADLSQAKDQDYFSDGMSEELLTGVAETPHATIERGGYGGGQGWQFGGR